MNIYRTTIYYFNLLITIDYDKLLTDALAAPPDYTTDVDAD